MQSQQGGSFPPQGPCWLRSGIRRIPIIHFKGAVMNPSLVKVGRHVLNLAAVASAHWERETLYVHLLGGRFVSFKGDEAQLIWQAVSAPAVDLETGEIR